MMLQHNHWAHQDPPAADDFFSPGVKYHHGDRMRPARGRPWEDHNPLTLTAGTVPPASPTQVQSVLRDPSQTIATWLQKDHALAKAKLKEWVENKQRELLSASSRHNTVPEESHGTDDSSNKRPHRPPVPTTPKKQIHVLSTPAERSSPSDFRLPSTPSKPTRSRKLPKTPHDPAEALAAYKEWLRRKSAELDRAAVERTRREAEKAAQRQAATALAKQRYNEWKATRKAPAPPVRPRLHQFPIPSSNTTPSPSSSAHLSRETTMTFAEAFGDVAFHASRSQGEKPALSAPRSSSQSHLVFGRLLAPRSGDTAAVAAHKHHTASNNTVLDPPDLLSPPGMFSELERMQRYYPTYLKRFPGHVAHAGASVGKVWIDPADSIQAQAATAAKWARLNSAVGRYGSAANGDQDGPAGHSAGSLRNRGTKRLPGQQVLEEDVGASGNSQV